MGSATWFVVMTMLSAAYGDLIPATPVGRVISIITLVTGAVLASLLIAIVMDAYEMEEVKIMATAEV